MAGLVGSSPWNHCLVARKQKCRKAPMVVHQADLHICTAENGGHSIFGLSDSKASSPSYFLLSSFWLGHIHAEFELGLLPEVD